MPGFWEWVIILVIVLIVFGANKLPAIGDALGRSIKNFKRATNVDDDAEPEKLESKDKGKQLAAKKPAKELAGGSEGEDGEWEEVVVRRRKKSSASSES